MRISLELQPCLKNKSGIGVYTYELTKRLQNYPDCQLTGDLFNFLNRNDISKDVKGLNFNKDICSLIPYRVYRKLWNFIPIQYNTLFKEERELSHFFNFIVPPRIKGKVVNTIHDLTYLLYPDTMNEENLKRISQDIDYSIKRSDKIITISKSTRQDLIDKLHIPAEKIEVIYPGVEVSQFNQVYTEEMRQVVRTRYKLPKKYMLYMGTIEPRKNIESIVEAFALFKKEEISNVEDVKLVIAGKKGWLYESIFKCIQRLELQDEVVFTDYVDEMDKALIYQMALVFVFPSLYEGFGIPVLEAMAAGVPVITSNVSSLPEVAGDAAILVEPCDRVAIAKGMQQCIKRDKGIEELIERGYKQIRRFSWDKSAEQLHALYQRLIEENY